ncbi:MAG: DUF3450 domain-containing protein [Eubacterium sp.]|nr:DUF3450 domain-containing protein [Eubacterium sp.]
MDTFRDMIMQYRDVQNILMFFAAIGAFTILYLIIKFIWLLCSGGIKLEASIIDRKQNRKIRAQEKEIESLKGKISELESISEEVTALRSKMEQ